jgi:hypothetical protein
MKLPDSTADDRAHWPREILVSRGERRRAIKVASVRIDEEGLRFAAQEALLDECHLHELERVLEAAQRVRGYGAEARSPEEAVEQQLTYLLLYLEPEVRAFIRRAIAIFDPASTMSLHRFISRLWRRVRICRHCNRVFLPEGRATAYCSEACRSEERRALDKKRSRAEYMGEHRRQKKERALIRAVVQNARAKHIGKPDDIAARIERRDPAMLEAVERLAEHAPVVKAAYKQFSPRGAFPRVRPAVSRKKR